MKSRTRSTVNVTTLLVVLAANGLAGSGALGAGSVGEVANRFPSLFLPADWVFGIWILIYCGLTAFVVYQALPWGRSDPVVARIGGWWAVNGLLNAAWVVTFTLGAFTAALLLLGALLATLLVIYRRIGTDRTGPGRATRWSVAHPFSLYTAWISVALVANAFQWAVWLGWDGLGRGATVASILLMGAGATVAWAVVRRSGDWIFPVVFAWAFAGIVARFPERAPVVAAGCTAGLLSLGAAWVGLRARLRERAA